MSRTKRHKRLTGVDVGVSPGWVDGVAPSRLCVLHALSADHEERHATARQARRLDRLAKRLWIALQRLPVHQPRDDVGAISRKGLVVVLVKPGAERGELLRDEEQERLAGPALLDGVVDGLEDVFQEARALVLHEAEAHDAGDIRWCSRRRNRILHAEAGVIVAGQAALVHQVRNLRRQVRYEVKEERAFWVRDA